MEAAQIGTNFSCNHVLELCRAFSKRNCVSLIRKKMEIILRGTKIVDCRYNQKSLNRQSFSIDLNEFSLFQAVDSSILIIISIIMKLLNLNIYMTNKI